MCLFDFVEKNYRIRLSAYLLGKLTCLVVADVSRRRAYDFCNRMFLHIFAHIKPYKRVFVVKKRLGERFYKFGFARSCGPYEYKRHGAFFA